MSPFFNKNHLLLILLSFSSLLPAQKIDGKETDSLSLDDLNQQLENPLSRFWSLILQENYNINNGTAVDGNLSSNVLNFQPSLPIPITKGSMLLVRPVFPLVTQPTVNEEGQLSNTYETGFGDMNVFSLYGPDKKGGLIWGAGLTFSFPTASSENLGSGKFETGPALMLLSITPDWTIGGIVQQWYAVAGSSERDYTSDMEIQYIVRRQIKGKGMSVGMGPSILIDWTADGKDRYTVPVGLGITKTVRWGNTPWKLRLEPQYSIIKPETYGTEWIIRIQIAPIINNPFF